MIKKTLPKIVENIDIIAAIIGIFLGTLIIYLYYAIDLYQQDIGFVLLTASLIYLLLRNKFKKTTFAPLTINHQVRLLLNIIFFIIFSITLLIWHTQLYCRPPSYFILISLLAGIIAIEILYFKEGAPVCSILFKILLLSANIRAGIFYNFPSIMGADAFWHAKMAQLITNTGFVPPFEIIEKYFYYPVSHIFASVTQTVCQIDIKDALFSSIALVSIISTIFIFLIGKQLAGAQVGLLATLLANVLDTIINRGTNINPGSLVLCYFLLILYLVFKERHRVINGSLIILITLLAVISHQLSTFVCFICLASIYVGKSAYKIIYKHKESVIIGTSYILLFAVAMQSYWMYTYAHPGRHVFDWLLGPLVNVLESGTELGYEMAVTHAVYYSTLSNILFHLGYLILLFFAIGGALLWLSSKEDKKISIVAAVIVLYIFVYAIPVFAINNMLPGRWFPFLYVFLAMLASAYLFKIIQLIKFNPNKTFAIFSIIFIISFFMITTPNINKDNPLYAKERGAYRTMFKASEISAITTINDLYNGTIKVDSSYVSGLFRQMTIRSTVEGLNIEYYITHPNIVEKKGTLILLRSSGFSIGRKYHSLPKEFLDKFKSDDYDLVYDNGEAGAYISR